MSNHRRHPSHQLKEIYCTELPSRFVRSRISSKTADEAIRLATENHRVTLEHRDGKVGEEYSISTKRLASKKNGKSKEVKEDKETCSTAINGEEICTCVSHSSLSLKSKLDGILIDSVEAFAIAREYRPQSNSAAPTNEAKPSHVKSKSETSIGGVSITDSLKDDAGSTVHDEANGKTLSYELLVNFRITRDTELAAKTTRQRSMSETISLSFCPSIIHIAELSISTGDKESGKDQIVPVIGIYVSRSDDNRLRLYIATKQSLDEKVNDNHGPVKSPCFILASLSFHPTNIETNDDATNQTASDLFTFCSSITALDTLNENRLAVALFDGTIHIMTYYLHHSGSLPSLDCRVTRSMFIIDGPVVTLHFGELNMAQICAETNHEHMSSTFLVAGSLCGFACLFYEARQPCSGVIGSGNNEQSNAALCFDGPLLLVDDLYDPNHCNEDCITAVCVCCLGDAKPMIAIGTQRGRILLFQRTTDPKYAFDESSFLSDAALEQTKLCRRVAETQSEIDILQSDCIGLRAESERALLSIAELESELESLESNLMSDGQHDDNSNASDGEDDQSVEFIGDIQAESFLLQSRINVLKDECSGAQERLQSNETKISDLYSSLLTLESELNETKTATIATLHSYVRKMHRYELTCQQGVPYPIQGLYFHREKLLTFTRRTVHVFHKTWRDACR
ncbi:hypothetical protein ACHAWO_003768 [Cyclotella atomus]|uniref:Uncharacterized protein n=1 Tax=Cyclotella atomus TaxID=382360 RepID=A0ABD3NFK9_9STRA